MNLTGTIKGLYGMIGCLSRPLALGMALASCSADKEEQSSGEWPENPDVLRTGNLQNFFAEKEKRERAAEEEKKREVERMIHRERIQNLNKRIGELRTNIRTLEEQRTRNVEKLSEYVADLPSAIYDRAISRVMTLAEQHVWDEIEGIKVWLIPLDREMYASLDSYTCMQEASRSPVSSSAGESTDLTLDREGIYSDEMFTLADLVNDVRLERLERCLEDSRRKFDQILKDASEVKTREYKSYMCDSVATEPRKRYGTYNDCLENYKQDPFITLETVFYLNIESRWPSKVDETFGGSMIIVESDRDKEYRGLSRHPRDGDALFVTPGLDTPTTHHEALLTFALHPLDRPKLSYTIWLYVGVDEVVTEKEYVCIDYKRIPGPQPINLFLGEGDEECEYRNVKVDPWWRKVIFPFSTSGNHLLEVLQTLVLPESQLAQLRGEYKELADEQEALIIRYGNLRNDYGVLAGDYRGLEGAYAHLANRYQWLQADNRALSRQTEFLSEIAVDLHKNARSISFPIDVTFIKVGASLF